MSPFHRLAVADDIDVSLTRARTHTYTFHSKAAASLKVWHLRKKACARSSIDPACSFAADAAAFYPTACYYVTF